jgi:ATP-dependent helicase/nuclease subunit A
MTDPTPAALALADDADRDAIGTDLENSYVVEAGAGSGKSTAMVRRVLALVDATPLPSPITRIAAITFTEKAALELRVKIRDALLTPSADPDIRARREAALADLDSAPIGTIHSFCANILRRLPLEAGVPPRLELEDAATSQISTGRMWQQIRADVLDTHPDEVLALLQAGVGSDVLGRIAMALHESWDRTQRWLQDDAPTPTGPAGAATATGGGTDATATADTGGTVSGAAAVVELRRLLRELDGLPVSGTSATAAKVTAVLAADLAVLDGNIAGADGNAARSADTGTGADRAGAGSPGVGDVVPGLLSVLGTVQELKPGSAKVWGPDTKPLCAQVNEQIAVARSALVQELLDPVVRRIGHEVLEAARERRLSGNLQFQDLLVLTRNLLVGPYRERAHAVLHEQLRWILVDEFQDTDPLQAEILFRIAADGPSDREDWTELRQRPGQLFVVGDPKQSIYRFRGADVSTYTAATRALESQGARPASLRTNFRSDPDVLDWINATFGTLMLPQDGIQPRYEPLDVRPLAPAPRALPSVRRRAGDDDSDDAIEGLLPPPGPGRVAALAAHSAGPAEHTTTPIDLRAGTPDDGEGSAPSADGPAVLRYDAEVDEDDRGLAEHIASALAEILHDEGEQTFTIRSDLHSPPRRVRPQDVAILLRSRTALPDIEDALDARGIEYRTEASTLIYSTAEIRELRLVLQALANPADTGSLVLALRTSLLGCGDDDLATWRFAGGRWNIHGQVPDGQEEHPVARALAELAALEPLARRVSPADLLDHLVESSLLHAVVADSPRQRDVSRRLTYVIDQARAWWEETHGSLREYLAWIALEDTDDATGSETVLDERDSSAVRILTMHAAKGLEFPVVLLVTGRRPRSDRPTLLWDEDRPRIGLSTQLSTPGYEVALAQDKEALDAELLRLLYVACTRAEHLLVLPSYKPPKNPPSHTLGRFLWTVAEGADLPGVDTQPVTVGDTDAPPASDAASGVNGTAAQESALPDASGAAAQESDPSGPPPGAWPAPMAASAATRVPAWIEAWEQERARWQQASACPATIAVTARAHVPAHAEDAAAGPDRPPEAADAGTPNGIAQPLGSGSDQDADTTPLISAGTTFGTALHRILELSRLDPAADIAALTEQVASQSDPTALPGPTDTDGPGTTPSDGVPVPRTLDRARLEAMARFALDTEVMREAAAGRHWFELDMLATDRVDPGIVLTGRADLVFVDRDGRVHVVDFKSDRAPSDTRIAEYKVQVRSYLDTLVALTGWERGDGHLLFAAPEIARVLTI